MAVVPYKDKEATKKEQVAEMFNSISGKYDFLNHTLSLGIDKLWRKKAVQILKRGNPKTILDIASGTADFAIAAMKTQPEKIIGIDISEGMLNVGREKLKKSGLSNTISLELGDSENLRFEDNSFDAVIVAFGVRNFENLERGLSEMLRVLRPGGTVVILEFSKPSVFPFKQIYNAYFKYILPVVGKAVSKDNSAYTYLPESVAAFPFGNTFLEIMQSIGYRNNECVPLTLGISSIYTGRKPS